MGWWSALLVVLAGYALLFFGSGAAGSAAYALFRERQLALVAGTFGISGLALIAAVSGFGMHLESEQWKLEVKKLASELNEATREIASLQNEVEVGRAVAKLNKSDELQLWSENRDPKAQQAVKLDIGESAPTDLELASFPTSITERLSELRRFEYHLSDDGSIYIIEPVSREVVSIRESDPPIAITAEDFLVPGLDAFPRLPPLEEPG